MHRLAGLIHFHRAALRTAAFSNIHSRQKLEVDNDAFSGFFWERASIDEHAVKAEADNRIMAARDEVKVGSAALHRFGEETVRYLFNPIQRTFPPFDKLLFISTGMERFPAAVEKNVP